MSSSTVSLESFDGGADLSARVMSLAQTLGVNPLVTRVQDYEGLASIPLVCGHRGAIFEEPENSISGFLTAAQFGCDAVELDVSLLKCGNLVVFHGGGTDENPGALDCYCGMEGANILNYTAEEVRLLKLNPDCPEFACPKDKVRQTYIPSLEEVLTIIKEQTNLIVKIELKGAGTSEAALTLVERLDMVDRCSFSSFQHERIARIRELRPDLLPDGTYRYKTGALYNSFVPDDFVGHALHIGASEVHLKYDTCTKERVDAVHAAGLTSMAWFRGAPGMKEDSETKYFDVGNEDEDMYLTVLRSGVKIMCVNRPNVLIESLKRSFANYMPTSDTYAIQDEANFRSIVV